MIVRLTAENGETGFGEASPFAPVTGESTASVTAALDVFRQGIIGMDVCDFEGVHAMMDHLTVGDTSAKCAMDIAMYDLLGKLTGLPVYKLLGGACNTVENDITIGINTPDKMAEAAERYVKEGFRILKIKIGINPDEDIEALSKIRKAVGPSIRLRVDANQGYTAQQAVDVIKKLKPIDVEAIEQCLPYWDIRGMAYVRDHASGIKVMADESIHSPHAADCKRRRCGCHEYQAHEERRSVSGTSDQRNRRGCRDYVHGRLHDGDKDCDYSRALTRRLTPKYL